MKRAIQVKGAAYVVTLTPLAMKVTRKGHQHGIEIPWESLVSGERALAVALQASIGQFEPNATARIKQRELASSVEKPRRAKAKARSAARR